MAEGRALGAPPAVVFWTTLQALWWRDVVRFFRQPTRIVGALGQPVLFWGLIGSGFADTFVLPGQAVPYPSFFYAGVILMVALFTSIFASVGIIEDRREGLLLAVLGAPAARLALVFGKCLGAASVAAAQIALFLTLAPLAHYPWGGISWLPLVAALWTTCFGLSALGFAVAWRLDNVQAYHAVQMTLLVPLWVLSGAMFPLPSHSWMGASAALNPMSYGVSAVRHALHGGLAPAASVSYGPGAAHVGLLLFCGLALGAAWRSSARAG